ncbi:MAG TPA: hypothetical protein VMK31_04685 [Sphingomicrobium sp.]|nr:hypothetical protein [Sphingomicrobium sp.]
MTVTQRLTSALLVLGLFGCMQESDPRESVEGSWEPIRASGATTDMPILQYRLDGDRLQMASSTGHAYDSKLGGGPVPLEGAPAGTTVAVQDVQAVAYREIVMRNGQPVAVRLIAVSDRKIATIFENRLDGSAEVFAAVKR